MNWLGDAVMALPAVERVRESRPSARITLLTAAKLADLFAHHPAIDEVLPFDKGDGLLATARRLRGKFDAALILPNSFRSAAEVWAAGIPKRIGYSGNLRGVLLTQIVKRRAAETRMHKRTVSEIQGLIQTDRPRETFPASAHHIHQYLHLAGAMGASAEPVRPRITVEESEREAFCAKFGIARTNPIMGLNPGAEYGPAKRWPRENFIAAAKQVSAKLDCGWLVFGGAGDREAAAGIAAALPGAKNIAGATSLRELCVGLSICRAVITNDTGPMHLAAAAGARVIVPFGSTSPELTGPGLPGGHYHRLILGAAQCAPCFRRTCPVDFRCMRSITPNRTAEAALAL